MATCTHSTPVLTRRAALVGAVALSTLAPLPASAAPFELSADFQELRRLAGEHSVVIGHWENARGGDRYWHERLVESAARAMTVCERIHSRPVTDFRDLFDRAAVVLHMSDGSWLPGAWDHPVAHLRSLEIDPGEDRELWASTELAAAIFTMAGFDTA